MNHQQENSLCAIKHHLEMTRDGFSPCRGLKTNHQCFFHFASRWKRWRRTWRAPSLSGSGRPKTSRNNWMHSGTSMSSRCVSLCARLCLQVRAWNCSRVHKRSRGKSSLYTRCCCTTRSVLLSGHTWSQRTDTHLKCPCYSSPICSTWLISPATRHRALD